MYKLFLLTALAEYTTAHITGYRAVFAVLPNQATGSQAAYTVMSKPEQQSRR